MQNFLDGLEPVSALGQEEWQMRKGKPCCYRSQAEGG